MPRPPEAIVYVARANAATGAVILLYFLVLHLLLHDSSFLVLSRNSYVFSLGLGILYAGAGVLVWFGLPPGRWLSFVCGVLFLIRPPLGLKYWAIIRSAEFKAHFGRGVTSGGVGDDHGP